MVLTVKARGNLNQDTFDGSASWRESKHEQLIVDLRRLRFIDGYALVALLTVITLWERKEARVRLRLPTSQAARTYLARMHFFELLPSNMEVDPSPPVVTERPSMLVPLRRLNVGAGEQAIEELARFVWHQLPHRLADSFTEAVAEIGINVIQHAESDIAFVAAQRFEKRYQGRPPPRLQLVVSDAGVGIRQSLSRGRPEAAGLDDVQAIGLALEEGVTGRPGVNSGVGLTTVRDYADAFMGVLRVRSGTGMVVIRRRKESSRRVPHLPGTLVAVELASPGRRLQKT